MDRKLRACRVVPINCKLMRRRRENESLEKSYSRIIELLISIILETTVHRCYSDRPSRNLITNDFRQQILSSFIHWYFRDIRRKMQA